MKSFGGELQFTVHLNLHEISAASAEDAEQELLNLFEEFKSHSEDFDGDNYSILIDDTPDSYSVFPLESIEENLEDIVEEHSRGF